jgi:HEAT repeat protein/cyclophilin family peptidyl-prolyl cis-trans isomerase
MTRRPRLLSLTCGAGVVVWMPLLAACATTPAPPPSPAISVEQKMAWILQLEDQRILRLPPPPAPAPTPEDTRRRRPIVVPPPASSPDLAVLLKDEDPRVRRRAALAVGRVRLPEGIKLLTATLADTDPDVQSTAAFAIGLVGDPSAEAELVALLSDPVPLVRGRAAEALGQTGAKGAAAAIGNMVAEYARTPAVVSMQPDDETWPAAGEAEAFKLGLFALVRLQAFDPLAAAVLEGNRPVSSWWPVAYALQRIEDKRAAPALLALLKGQGRYTRAFAARGLGSLRDQAAVQPLLALLAPESGAGLEPTVAAIRALAQLGAADAVTPLSRLAAGPGTHANVRLEAVQALGTLEASQALDLVQNLLTDEWTPMRIAALRALASIDQESFTFVLAGIEPDRDWRVRAALAGLLAGLPGEIGLNRLRPMLNDEDKRVIPAVLDAMARLRAPELGKVLLERIKDPDFVVRSSAAQHLGKLKPEGGADALREAYKAGLPDSAYSARAAAIDALVEYGPAESTDTLKAALSDKDWAVRVRAADLLARIDPQANHHEAIRPAPGSPVAAYDDPHLLGPPYSPHVFIDTAQGTIEFELAVLDAPLTARNFISLARRGFFNGLQVHRVIPNFVVQDGDPRGDGQGGPGYTIRDELSDRPFLRGTVGMALAWRDTGASQFFITHSPQPHLDARYTVFGHVVNGMDIVDRIRPDDVIERVRVWDGQAWE